MADIPISAERPLKSRCCDPAPAGLITPEEAQQISDDMQILAHPVRLQLLDMLARQQGQVCVCDLEAGVPVKQPTVSHHLRLLREAGLVDCERRGPWVYYFLQREKLAALRARVMGRLEVFG